MERYRSDSDVIAPNITLAYLQPFSDELYLPPWSAVFSRLGRVQMLWMVPCHLLAESVSVGTIDLFDIESSSLVLSYFYFCVFSEHSARSSSMEANWWWMRAGIRIASDASKFSYRIIHSCIVRFV